MKDYILEVCVDSVESARAAVEGGADRLELCTNLVIGGTTPGVSQFKQIRKFCDVPINVLVRPRYGDFLYTEAEFLMVLEDVELLRNLGADGVVVGFLKPDGTLDLERLKAIREKTRKGHLTLHRAFDLCLDPYQALEEAIKAGTDTILTSGQQQSAWKGRELLAELSKQAAGRLDIMAGGGVDPEVIAGFLKESSLHCFHMSGKMILNSAMTYRKAGVSMGVPGLGEYDIYFTNKERIRQAKELLESNKNILQNL